MDSPTCPDIFEDLFFLQWEASDTGAAWFNKAPSAGAGQATCCQMHSLNTRASAGNSQQILCLHTPSERHIL